MAAAVPLVEFSDDTDAVGIGRPHGEANALRAIVLHQARAELFI